MDVEIMQDGTMVLLDVLIDIDSALVHASLRGPLVKEGVRVYTGNELDHLFIGASHITLID
jgi:hypothetical protein